MRIPAAIGLAVGSGFWIIGVGSTMLVLLITYGIGGVSHWLERRQATGAGGS